MNPYILSSNIWKTIGYLFVGFMILFGLWAFLHGIAAALREWTAYNAVKRQYRGK